MIPNHRFQIADRPIEPINNECMQSPQKYSSSWIIAHSVISSGNVSKQIRYVNFFSQSNQCMTRLGMPSSWLHCLFSFVSHAFHFDETRLKIIRTMSAYLSGCIYHTITTARPDNKIKSNQIDS